LIAAARYFAYDDYYKQRPALEQAQAEIEQFQQNPIVPTYAPAAKPAWFQKRVEQGSSLDSSREYSARRKGVDAAALTAASCKAGPEPRPERRGEGLQTPVLPEIPAYKK
jgi:hypothetical protein